MRAVIERLTSDPKIFPDGRLEAGDFYVRVRDYPAALAQYEEGERQNPGAKTLRVYRKKMAEVLATQGSRDQAEKIVAGLLKDDSKDPEALALHATLMLASGDPRQVKAAIAELQPLIAKMPRNATLRFNLGRAYMGVRTQNRDKAREQLEAALRLDPHHAPAKLAWAELALARGEPARGDSSGLRSAQRGFHQPGGQADSRQRARKDGGTGKSARRAGHAAPDVSGFE